MAAEVSPVIAVLGLGEAGSRLCRDLCQMGAQVRGWDPAPQGDVSGIPVVESPQAAAAGADLVLSVNAASAALAAASSVLPVLRPSCVFADLNTAAPDRKGEVSRLVDGGGAAFVDVALLGPVPRAGIRTPCLASGTGAVRFAALMAPYGMPVEVLDGPAGLASARKLLRSVFMKGMAAAVIEALEAAEAHGCREWVEREIERELEGADAALVGRLVEGSRAHARRRVEEMEAAAEMVRQAGVTPLVAEAAVGRLRALLEGGR
jgi:3-hydroxyisobutyrate dehydrogenase-like beta-hydroxyacid dehydrogenase